MIKSFISNYMKISGIGTFALLFTLFIGIISYFLADHLSNYKYDISLMWVLLITPITLGLAIALSFDSFHHYSQYGLSHNHPILNHVVSIVAIILPFGVLIWGFYPVLASLALNGYSKYRSPDTKHEKTLPIYKRKFIVDCINFILLACILALAFFVLS